MAAGVQPDSAELASRGILQGSLLPGGDLRSSVLTGRDATTNLARETAAAANNDDHVAGGGNRAPGSVYRPSPIEACPTDVLCIIFEAVVRDAAEAHDRGTSMDIFDWNMEQLLIRPPTNAVPFLLSAVCRFWRELVLNLPFLWSFITVPPPGPSTPFYVAHMIERSQNYPLDFRFIWPSISNNMFDRATGIEQFLSCRHRWRTVHFGINSLYQVDLNLLCDPTPLLQELLFYRIWKLEENPRITYPPLLPSCPRLRTLRTGVFSFFRRPQYSQLSHLTHLECRLKVGCKEVWDLLGSCPLLVHLGVQLYRVDRAPKPDFVLKLPSLRTLISSGFDSLIAEWIDHIEMPALATVELHQSPNLSVHATVRAIVERFCASVTTFRYQDFGGRLRETHADVLAAALPRLRVLRLDGAFASKLLGRLLIHTVWPDLKEVTISANNRTLIGLEEADALWSFIRSRAASELFVTGQLILRNEAGGYPLRVPLNTRIEDSDVASHRLLEEMGKLRRGAWSQWSIRIRL